MSETEFFDVLRQALWVTTVMSAPLLGVALAVGLAIGLLQALTAIQETTLTFVPKLGAMLIVFWVAMAFMSRAVVAFFDTGILPLIARS